jgi:hypothetical protein
MRRGLKIAFFGSSLVSAYWNGAAMYYRGVGVFDTLLEKAVLEMRQAEALAAFWDVDALATLERVLRNSEDHFRSHTYLRGGGYWSLLDHRRLGEH